MQQRSPEWFAARCGYATASRFADILATVRNGEAAARRNYRAQLVVERLTGQPQETYSNQAMQWGVDNEPLARGYYEILTDNVVIETGFLTHHELRAGCSPDGLIGDDGGIEIKCPYQSAVHIDTLLNGMPTEHMAQIQGAMWITGRQWWDFVSFDPRMPEHLRIKIVRIERDEKFIANLEDQVRKFLDETEALEQRLRAM